MKEAQEKLQLRQVGRGFILCSEKSEEQNVFTGRRLTKAYVDQYDRPYVKVNGQIEPLTEQHSFLAAD